MKKKVLVIGWDCGSPDITFNKLINELKKLSWFIHIIIILSLLKKGDIQFSIIYLKLFINNFQNRFF